MLAALDGVVWQAADEMGLMQPRQNLENRVVAGLKRKPSRSHQRRSHSAREPDASSGSGNSSSSSSGGGGAVDGTARAADGSGDRGGGHCGWVGVLQRAKQLVAQGA